MQDVTFAGMPVVPVCVLTIALISMPSELDKIIEKNRTLTCEKSRYIRMIPKFQANCS